MGHSKVLPLFFQFHSVPHRCFFSDEIIPLIKSLVHPHTIVIFTGFALSADSVLALLACSFNKLIFPHPPQASD